MKKRILMMNVWYLPGIKGGGPVQSCNNIVELLKDKFDFYIITSDRDLNDKKPYSNIKINCWNKLYGANIYYLSPERQNYKEIKNILNSFHYDVLYLSTFYSPVFTIYPLILSKLHKIPEKTIILAPRGDFGAGLKRKKYKKIPFIIFAKLFNLYKNVIWHAASDIEKNMIKKIMNPKKLIVINNLPIKSNRVVNKTIKSDGLLKIIYISRIHPTKNLKFALEILKKVKGKVIFDIYGPIELPDYWDECNRLISNLPKNVIVNYCGILSHDKVPSTFQKYDVFLFPTMGENYGHVILEAMLNKCVCILSKGTTPWDGYIEKLGIGGTLNDSEKFVNDIECLINMNQQKFNKLILKNDGYVKHYVNIDNIKNKYIDLFNGKW